MNRTTIRPWALHATAPTGRPQAEGATLWIYDPIDSYGGDWGVSALDVRDTLAGFGGADLSVRINSPGGDYFEAVAIRTLLAQYPGKVTMRIDGLAASAATVIATAGDHVVMAPGAQYMIHDALTIALGNAAEMRRTADLLDQCSDDIAGFYAAKAGGDAATFRDAMRAETWYTAEQAVAAGLADELAGAPAEPAVAASAARWIAAMRPAAEPAPIPAPVPDTNSTAAVVAAEAPASVSDPLPTLSELFCSALTTEVVA